VVPAPGIVSMFLIAENLNVDTEDIVTFEKNVFGLC
jgi:hypothetical protein